MAMSALPRPQGLVNARVGITRGFRAGQLALHTLHTGAEGVAARTTLRLGTLQVAARSLVVGTATKFTKSPHGVLVLGLELKLGLVCHGLEGDSTLSKSVSQRTSKLLARSIRQLIDSRL